MNRREYGQLLEQKLILEFKNKFQDKVGYTPMVVTKIQFDIAGGYLPMLSMETLESFFDPYLPEAFGKTLRLQSSSRKRSLVELRNIFCALGRMMGHTCEDIGAFLGGRDHTTVVHNTQTFHDLVETSDTFRTKYLTIVNDIKTFYECEPSTMDQFDQAQREPKPAVLS